MEKENILNTHIDIYKHIVSNKGCRGLSCSRHSSFLNKHVNCPFRDDDEGGGCIFKFEYSNHASKIVKASEEKLEIFMKLEYLEKL